MRLMARGRRRGGQARGDVAALRLRRHIPDVFPAAPIFTAKGGWWDQGEPPGRRRRPVSGDAGEAARAAVRKAKELGAAEIKLMLDDMGWCRAPKPRASADDGRRSPRRSSPRRRRAGAARHRPRPESRRREGSDRGRRDRSRARRARSHRRRDDRRHEEAARLLHPDDGHLRVPRGHASVRGPRAVGPGSPRSTAAEEGRRAVPLAGVLRRLSGALSELRERGAASPDAPAEPPTAARRRRVPSRSAPTCGRFPGSACRSRWISTCGPGCPPLDALRVGDREPRPGPSESTPTAARSKPGSAPTSWFCPQIPSRTSATSGGSRRSTREAQRRDERATYLISNSLGAMPRGAADRLRTPALVT